MIKVRIAFKGDLADILPPGKKEVQDIVFPGKRSIKDLVESCEIPHTEIGRIFVEKKEVGASYVLSSKANIEVYPPTKRGGKYPLLFLCDEHLWKLARRLRLLGFDTAFDKKWDDADLARISVAEGRFLLTRDRGLLMRKIVSRGCLIRSTNTEIQVEEVLDKFDCRDKCKPFTRCLHCSGLLTSFQKDDDAFDAIKSQVPPQVMNWCKVFDVCSDCKQVYWQGTHYQELVKKVKAYIG